VLGLLEEGTVVIFVTYETAAAGEILRGEEKGGGITEEET
jgi:hypothetical protein